MSAMKLKTFGGEVPRLDSADIKNNQAELARNTNLYSGDIIPYKGIDLEKELSERTKTVFPFENSDGSLKWIDFDFSSNIIKSQFDGTDQRIFISPDTGGLLTTDYSKYPEISKLGCPRPQITPTATLGGGGSGTALSTLYVYTFVNEFGEESAPSDPTPAVLKKDGQLVLLTIPDTVSPMGYKIEKKRIYRSVATEDVSGYFFLGEVPVSQIAYVDVKLNEYLNEKLSTILYKLPQDDFRGLITLPSGIFVCHTDKEIYFSEPNLPGTYPEKYMLSIPENIVGLCPIAGNQFAVLTDENPYICIGEGDPSKMRIVKTKANYPCVDKRSIVDTGFGCVYASHEGLVKISNSTPQLLTGKSHAKETFSQIVKNGMNSLSYGNKYIGSCNIGTMVFDFAEPTTVSRLSERPQCGYYDKENDNLYLVINGHLVRYNVNEKYPTISNWHSKLYRFNDYINMGAFRVLGDFRKDMIIEDDFLDFPTEPIATGSAIGEMSVGGLSGYNMHKDKGMCILEFWRGDIFIAKRYVVDDSVYRLPKTYKDDNISIKITTNIRIREFHIGKSPLSLKKV